MIKRGGDPLSRCKLIAAGSKYTISVELIVEEGYYSSTNRKLSVVRLVANLGRKCSDDVVDRLIFTNDANDNSRL